MRANTHITFGVFSYFVFCAVANQFINLTNLGIVIFGALLPDIDTPKSLIGRFFFFISHRINVRLGHRTFTHSFLFALVLAIIFYSITYFYPKYQHYLLPFMIGFLSHIFLDCINKEGVCLFYPSNVHCVLPGKSNYRIQTGSNAEWAFLAILLVFTLLAYPVAERGLIKTLHYLMADIQSAVVDFEDYSIDNEVFAEVVAANNLSNKKIQDTFKVVGKLGKNVLIVATIDNRLKTIGEYEENNFRPIKIRLKKGRPVDYVIQKIELSYCKIDELKNYLNPDYDQRIFGTIQLINSFDVFNEPEFYNPIKYANNTLNLNYATYFDIERLELGEVYLAKAELMIKTALYPGQEYKQKIVKELKNEEKYKNKYDIMLTVEDRNEILIAKDDKIVEGSVIARIERKNREIEAKTIYLSNLQKQLENVAFNTDIKNKQKILMDLQYQIENLNKDFIKLEKERGLTLENKRKKLELLKEQERVNQKKFNKIDLMTTELAIDETIAEIKNLENQTGKMPYEMKYKLDILQEEVKYTNQEIKYLTGKKKSDQARIQKDIKQAELDILDLKNKYEVKSPVSGLVVAVDFTMSLEHFLRVKISVLEEVEKEKLEIV